MDFMEITAALANLIQNERIASFNEGLDEERARCGKVIHDAIVNSSSEPLINQRLREIESLILHP